MGFLLCNITSSLHSVDIKPIFYYIIYLGPVVWGIYEFRKFRKSIKEFNKLFKIFDQRFDTILNDKVDNFPFLRDIKALTNKINKIINLSGEKDNSE